MFQQKRETINTYEGAHLLVKLRAVGRWYISIFHTISVVNKNEKITFSGITHNAKMFTKYSMEKAVLKDFTIFIRKRLG